MTVVKRSVALAEEIAAEADTVAGERGFSRLVNDALEQHLQTLRILSLYDELVARNGPVSTEIRRAVSDEWSAQLENA